MNQYKKSISEGYNSFRFITNMGEDNIHFAVIDNKTSLILFEPANFNSVLPAMLSMRTKIAIDSDQIPDCCFSMVELNIQKSYSNCGIFSLAITKKLYLEFDKLVIIYGHNIDGILPGVPNFLSHTEADKYLPANFYKHTQSLNHLNEYIISFAK